MVEEEKEHINDGIIADGDNGIPSRGEPSRWRLARHSSRKLGRDSYNWLYHSNCICALNVLQHSRIPSVSHYDL
ncbi:hypothetical protein RHMOL_Rhmol01G0039800 [Rhododendron molle]|uniref:Uncharacterized protein n=1 Tax=Rhododendron molle TaxID=49168 RepID=A0ACC0Q0T7_RHOML|nr:hypothetical protein RHMOL_Rhmol01G0039800 [Rhododendron molle]